MMGQSPIKHWAKASKLLFMSELLLCLIPSLWRVQFYVISKSRGDANDNS